MNQIRTTRNKAQSKSYHKNLFTSQIYSSNIPQNNNNSQSIKSYDNGYLGNILNLKNDDLAKIYNQTIEKHVAKAAMHIGICLKIQQILEIFKMLSFEKYSQISTYIDNKKAENIYIPTLHLKIQGCCIIFWIFQSKSIIDKSRGFHQADKLIEIFSSFPQIIITDIETYKIMSKRFINFPQILKFQQKILLLNNNSDVSYLNEIVQSQFRKAYHLNQISEKVLRNYILLTLKKNSQRCFNQTMEINMIFLSTFNNTKIQSNLSKAQLSQFLNIVVTAFVSLQKFNLQYWASKIIGPRQQNGLENELNNKQQQILRQVRKNIKILYQSQKQKHIIQQMQKKFLVQINTTLQNNRKQGKIKNDNLLNQLNQQFLNQFHKQKGKYATSDRVSLISRDFQQLLDEYQKRSIKLNSTFDTFNNSMKQKKKIYYDKIQLVEQQVQQNKKNYSFDEIQDKLQMKKKVLYTLQKQVKSLNSLKSRMQLQNENLKKLIDSKQFRRFDTQGEQQLMDQHTNKYLKTRTNNDQQMVGKNSKKYEKLHSQSAVEISKKKTCFQCCKCSIF